MSKEIMTFSQYLTKNQTIIKAEVSKALPKHLDSERMMRVLRTEIQKNPDLNKCTTQSILSAFIQSSQLGLEPGSALGQAYLIPYKDKCQFIIGYRGMIDLARRSGQLVSISAHAVYENDLFEFEFGLNEKLRHIPSRGEKGRFVCAYAYAKLSNTFDNSNGKDSYQFDVMFKNEIDDIKKQSPSFSKSFSPWQTHYEEMAKKTVIRRLFKYLPISIEAQRAASIDEAHERGDEETYVDLTPFNLVEEKRASKSDELASKITIDMEPIKESPAPSNFEDKLKAYEEAESKING